MNRNYKDETTGKEFYRNGKRTVKSRRNRPLHEYAEEVEEKWMKSRRKGKNNDEKLWRKYRNLDRMERIHALRNDEFPTASYQGESYTIDDPLPDTSIFVHYSGAPLAHNVYPNKGESLRECIEGRGERMEDITDWWMG